MQPQSWSPEEVGMARNCAITQILGTDMKKHFDILSRFQVLAACTCKTTTHTALHDSEIMQVACSM